MSLLKLGSRAQDAAGDHLARLRVPWPSAAVRHGMWQVCAGEYEMAFSESDFYTQIPAVYAVYFNFLETMTIYQLPELKEIQTVSLWVSLEDVQE